MNSRVFSLLSFLYNRTLHPRFLDLKRRAGGMLPAAVYHRLYDEVRKLPDLDIIEVGGAAGAGSIAIAWAMQESAKRSKLIVVERCEGGSRVQFGGRDENLKRLEQHFESFGVRDRIALYPHELTLETGPRVHSLISTAGLAALVHDADGRIDRDFEIFWERVQPRGLMVIDDFVELAEFKPISPRHPDGGIKCLLTFRLLRQFIAWGLFEPFAQVQSTIFGRKPEGADFRRFDRATCDRIRAEVARERAVAVAPRSER